MKNVNSNKGIKKVLHREKKVNKVKYFSLSLKKLQYEFISSTAHQLRTPIASIQSSFDVLELYIIKENTARQMQAVHKIKKSLVGLTNTLDRITTLYKNELVKQKLDIIRIEPHKFFNDLLDEVIIFSGETCLINISIEVSKKYIYADEFVLKQILLNLIGNSVKFSPQGGQIRLTVNADKKILRISIKDEGIGINKNDLINLYQPFFRGKNVSMIPGDGLGLAIVKKLCFLHKAKITCESELNKGTEFMISIPQPLKL